MSFGFSVGDFVAVGALIVKCIDSLRNTQSEYQELIRELESLKGALSQVDKLKGRGDQAIAIEQIKCAALTCKYPLEQFLAKIQKYEKSLGLGKSVDKVRDAGRKVQYALGRKDEANRLRNYLNLHIGTINMLMLQNGLEKLDVTSEQSKKDQEETKIGIDGCSKELVEVKGNVEAQVLAVRENNSILQKLFWMVSGEIAAPLKTMSQTVAKVCVSTQQIYTIVLELKNSAFGIDTRFTYFQAPVKVEDALGRVFPFSSECSIEALDAEIRSRFKKGPGKIEVMAGDFELFNAKNADQVLTIVDGNGLLPGMSINMAIVLEKDEKEFAEGDECPMPHCISKTFVAAIGGGRTCSDCEVWFDKATKKRKRGMEREEKSQDVRTLADPQYSEAERRKFDEESAEFGYSHFKKKSISAFKRIRFGDWVPSRPEESHEATEADSMDDEEQPPSQQQKGPGTTSSYWSVPEQNDVCNLLRLFGTNWQAIATSMKTKTHVMIKNFYNRKIREGDLGKHLKEQVARADSLRAIGPRHSELIDGVKGKLVYQEALTLCEQLNNKGGTMRARQQREPETPAENP